VIFDGGGVYFKNEGQVKGMNPHIEGLIFYNNDESLQPSTTRYMGSPSWSYPLRVYSSSQVVITHEWIAKQYLHSTFLEKQKI